jgi:hypothetical protein
LTDAFSTTTYEGRGRSATAIFSVGVSSRVSFATAKVAMAQRRRCNAFVDDADIIWNDGRNITIRMATTTTMTTIVRDLKIA